MADGSDAIADWPLLNAMVNTASGASWVSIHHGGGVGIGRSIHAGQVCVADGSALAGSASRMIDLVRTLVRDVDLPLHEAIAMATENPARAIRLETKGRLAVGADADFVVLSQRLEVLQTFASGAQIFPRSPNRIHP